MTNSDYPRLCGGTFFILVLQALRQRMKAREHYKGESDGLKDPNVLIGLIRVINPDYIEPAGDALKGKTNDFSPAKFQRDSTCPLETLLILKNLISVCGKHILTHFQR